ncbi:MULTISPECIES: CPBP family intramembrane glutamic endopeptidase [Geomicrobium]|uniref:Membrane protease YdiL (CAAX protease family) n=1 Tax=Geomicrobium sediminis TaxID=1347788 RepID=A0ABS2P9H4_9BACL|nr:MULTISPECIES: type II CAAX endopeptidase family protein [Geomicrobium]MBM7632040.1 membrane protease YdiL (CAAX protease family) [Geomicrobium sediminis]GAK10096.1 CAAX amino terminal protease family protein [Geomicrobium sp. JCM 19038]
MSYTLRYWLIGVTFLVAQFGSVGFAIIFALMGMEPGESFVYSIVLAFALGAIVMLFLIRNANPLMRADRPRSGVGVTIGLIFLGVLLAIVGQQVAFLIQSALFGVPAGSENTAMLLDMMNSFPIMLLAVVVFGPIMEEILFRQVIFGKLYKHMNFFFAAALSSLAFSVVHMEFSNILVYAGAGFAFAYVYVKSNRIIVPIIAHCLMNAWAAVPILLEYLGYDVLDMMEQMEQTTQLITGWLGLFL